MTDAAGVSGNHLSTQFKAHLGVTPKRLARIYRFAQLVVSVDARRPVYKPVTRAVIRKTKLMVAYSITKSFYPMTRR